MDLNWISSTRAVLVQDEGRREWWEGGTEVGGTEVGGTKVGLGWFGRWIRPGNR